MVVSSVRPEEERLASPPAGAWAPPGRAAETDTALVVLPLLSEEFCSTVWVERTTLLSGSKVSLVVWV